MPGQVVDTESAREFMREALQKITEAELAAIADECEVKRRRFSALLARPAGAPPTEVELRALLRSVFSPRRRTAEFFDRVGAERLAAWIGDLVAPRGPVEARFQAFYDRLEGFPESVRYDLAGELLHFTDPDRYWLWTRWVWDPKTRTGALPLVTMEEYDLDAPSVGAMYLRVGEAIAFVHETGRAAGMIWIMSTAFGQTRRQFMQVVQSQRFGSSRREMPRCTSRWIFRGP